MSSGEDTVQSILPLIKYYFVGHAQRLKGKKITKIDFVSTLTHERRGVSGSVFVSDVVYRTSRGDVMKRIALKFFHAKSSAINELKNAMELDIRFKSAPEFGVPQVIFASTKDPILIIYEGISGTNYDELEAKGKASEAGRLLASIHGSYIKPVDQDLYKNMIRIIGSNLSTTGKEKELSEAMRFHFEKLDGANSGTDPFSDFHQSNVMMTHFNHEIMKTYVIDPEFMQKGNFDRMEDMGTFFGSQLFEEYVHTGTIDEGTKDIENFLKGYQERMLEAGGSPLKDIYPRGNPLQFFLGQWGLMDALDISINRGGNLQSPDVINRINFVLYILKQPPILFPKN